MPDAVFVAGIGKPHGPLCAQSRRVVISSVKQPSSAVANSRAKAAAEFVHECLFPAHRAVFDCGDKFIVFGNDGYDLGVPPKREVELVEQYLNTLGFRAAEFAVSSNGYSWAMVVDNYDQRPIDLNTLRTALSECWAKAIDEASPGWN
jgi:hypothetical protein